MTSSFQRQYTQALLGSKPTDFHSKLWEWYEKEDKPKREKWLQQNAENEAKNPYARWFCAVKSNYTYGEFELGDVYVSEIKDNGVKVK